MHKDKYPAFARDGFVVLRDFLPQSAVAEVAEDALRVFQLQLAHHGLLTNPSPPLGAVEASMFDLFDRHLDDFINCGKQVQHLISLHRLALDRRIVDVLLELGLAFPNISTRPVLFFNHRRLAKKEVYWKVAAHQDWRSMQGSLNSVVVWVPLVDIGLDLGTLQVVPASHREGLITDRVEDSFGMVDRYRDDDFVSVELRRGDALFFSSFLVHRSGQNSTAAVRWSCHFRYNDLREPTFLGRGFPHPYLYKPLDTLLTPDFPSAEQVRAAFE
jgi:hypothetical protein